MSTSEAFAPSSDDKYTGKNGVIIVNDISIRNALATKIVSVTTHGTRTPPLLLASLKIMRSKWAIFKFFRESKNSSVINRRNKYVMAE